MTGNASAASDIPRFCILGANALRSKTALLEIQRHGQQPIMGQPLDIADAWIEHYERYPP